MGRKPKFSNEKQVADLISEYFGICDEKKQIPDKAGLCLFLGISRDTYNQYKKKYPDAVKGADLAIEKAWVARLAGPNATGAIFYLKNAFHEFYRDRYETDVTSGDKPLQPVLVKFIGDDNNSNTKGVQKII